MDLSRGIYNKSVAFLGTQVQGISDGCFLIILPSASFPCPKNMQIFIYESTYPQFLAVLRGSPIFHSGVQALKSLRVPVNPIP